MNGNKNKKFQIKDSAKRFPNNINQKSKDSYITSVFLNIRFPSELSKIYIYCKNPKRQNFTSKSGQ